VHFHEDGGVFTEAERYYQKALARAPDYHPALLRLGVIRWDQGRFAEAVRLGERALAVDPRAEWIRWPLAGFYLEVDEVDAARSVLLEAPEAVPPIPWLTICLYEQQPERAADLLRAEPNIPRFLYDDVRVYVLRDAALASGHLALGRDEILALPQGAAEDPFGLAAAAQLTLAAGDRKEAEKLAREMTGDGPYEIGLYRDAWASAEALAARAKRCGARPAGGRLRARLPQAMVVHLPSRRCLRFVAH
jgi:tetratricopeptide (TPR) repeat protein